MVSKKRKRSSEKPSIHPRNKDSENAPDFAKLASLYPTFEQYVFYSHTGRPRIDWTDFNATRELTRILLLHDHKLNWWIPDGQLCPTVPNRSNYIHWIEDLLSSDLVPKINNDDANVKGFDIGTGANCIYPLLGASLLGWSFVGSDVTDVALEWAEKNVKNNPHISELIEIRKAASCQETVLKEEVCRSENVLEVSRAGSKDAGPLPSSSTVDNDAVLGDNESYQLPPVLVGVMKDVEKYDFCMCNPPFFETMEEAGLNPKTACGGTPEEMVCYGGEKTFVTRIIEDSIVLKQSFRWFTSMVGRKYNLKFLVAKLWEVGAAIVKTTEFVQGQTSRWGLAWSFMLHARRKIAPPVVSPSVLSFTIQGVNRQFNAIHVLQHIESFFRSSGASVKINTSSFTVDIAASNDHVNAVLINSELVFNVSPSSQYAQETSSGSTTLAPCSNSLCFRVSIFQQVPGTLLVKGNLQKKDSQISGTFSLIFQLLEKELKSQFGKK